MSLRRYLRFRILIFCVVGVVACFVFVIVVTRPKAPNTHLKRRHLQWDTYEDYEDSPAKAYFDVPPKIITQAPIARPDDDDPHEIVFTKPLLLEFPWASSDHDYTAETTNFLKLIKNTENSQKCSKMFNYSNWSCCISDSMSRGSGIVYTFDVEQENNLAFETGLREMGNAQHIHAYNPNIKEVTANADSGVVLHKIALDTESNERQKRRWTRKTFKQIRSGLGHNKVNIVRLNMNSSEWKIMKQLLENGEIMHIDQLVVKIHLHWAGFGISGSSEEVVHQWFNIISSIIHSGMSLVSSKSDEEPKIFMSEPGLFDTSCCYYLTFSRLK